MRRPASEIAAERKANADKKLGKVLFFGRYRTRGEVVVYLLTHGWEGAHVVRDDAGWILILGTATCVLFPCTD